MGGLAFVVNPRSDGGRTGRAWPALEARLRRGLGEVDVLYTERRGDGTRLARLALEEGARAVVAVGGDGTNNEVLNGFFDEDRPLRPAAALGVLQRGTGGDFQRTLGPPPSVEAMARALGGDEARTIDVGRVRFVDHEGREASRYFLNIASFGVGGVFDFHLNRSRKLLAGRFATAWAGLRAALEYRNQPVTQRLDGGPAREVRVNNVAVANGRYHGGAMRVAPHAELDDGLFDVVTVGDLTLGDLAGFARRVYRGTHLEMRKVDVARAARVEATSRGCVLLDVDGEQPGRLPATFEVVPRALRLKVAAV
jgi:diacylglycerol kinase (ATP)